METRSSPEERDKLRILPIRVGEGEVEGILFNTIVPDARTRPAVETARLIVNRLSLIRQNPPTEKADTLVHSFWPKDPAPFKHGLADRTILEWPAVLHLLTSNSQNRILMFKGRSGFSKTALLCAAGRYAKALRVSSAYVDFQGHEIAQRSKCVA
jgi:hypothetical protein